MNLFSLNHDVLCEILSVTDAQSALQLSMVSRTAYAVGMPRALSSVTLSRSQQQVRDLCRFMLANRDNRIACLRELTIEPSAFGVSHHIEFQRTVDFSAAPELADLLERARRLRQVSIACFEDLIAREPRIGCALYTLPDLVEISLHNSAQLSLAVLNRMQSDLRTLAFTQLFNRKLPAFFHRLAKLTKLETLELAHIDLEGMGDEPYPDVQQIPQIPSLRSLSVRGTTARMDLFVHAFPHIQTLQVSGVYAKVDRNVDLQASRSSWSRLDHLRGNVPDFRYWNVVCPVRRLDLDLTAYHYTDTLDVVRRSSPAVLSLPVETKMDSGFWRALVEAAPRVRYLELCLDEGKAAKLPWWMENVPPILGTLPLDALLLCFRHSHPAATDMAADSYRLDESALRAFRDRIADLMPSLRYLALTEANKGSNPFEYTHAVPLWWRIAGAPGERSLVAVPLRTGEGMREHFRRSTHSTRGAEWLRHERGLVVSNPLCT